MAAVSTPVHLHVARLTRYPRSLLETSTALPACVCSITATDITCAAQDDRLVSSFYLVQRFMLTRCRVAVVFAIQAWLAETPEQKKTSSTPAYFQVGMSGKNLLYHTHDQLANYIAVMSLLVVSQPLGVTSPLMTDTMPQSYSSMFLPPPPVRSGQGSGTEAFAAAPPS
jgi:hypothetical protein